MSPPSSPRFPRRGRAVFRLRAPVERSIIADWNLAITALANRGCGTVLLDVRPEVLASPDVLTWLPALRDELRRKGTHLLVAPSSAEVVRCLQATGLGGLLEPAAEHRMNR